MPTMPGTCHRTRTVVVGQAEPARWTAWLVVGPEEIEVDGAKLTTTRIEQRTLRDNGWIAWVQDGEVVKHDYSGGKGTTIAFRTTKEKALTGLDPKLVPRTAK
jgi:hypothetical protein